MTTITRIRAAATGIVLAGAVGLSACGTTQPVYYTQSYDAYHHVIYVVHHGHVPAGTKTVKPPKGAKTVQAPAAKTSVKSKVKNAVKSRISSRRSSSGGSRRH